MKLSTIYRLTRERMQAQKRTAFGDISPYICDNIRAIGEADKVVGAVSADLLRAKQVIEVRIEGASSLQHWLRNQGHITVTECRLAGSDFDISREAVQMRAKMREYRNAWLIDLENEFAAKGD